MNIESNDFENDITTPKTHNRILIEQAENDIQNDLKSCCGSHTDRRLILLVAQITFSGMVLIFSGMMMALKEEEDKSVYMSLMSSICSFWLGVSLTSENKK